MLFETNKEKGRAGFVLGIAWFGANGYTVNIPLNDTQWYDFIAEKDGSFFTVQCKATGSKDNNIILKNTGGTSGTTYDSVLDHPLDYLFCVDKDQHLFVIPMQELRLAGNIKSIKLNHEGLSKFANKNSFDTSKYLVTL